MSQSAWLGHWLLIAHRNWTAKVDEKSEKALSFYSEANKNFPRLDNSLALTFCFPIGFSVTKRTQITTDQHVSLGSPKSRRTNKNNRISVIKIHMIFHCWSWTWHRWQRILMTVFEWIWVAREFKWYNCTHCKSKIWYDTRWIKAANKTQEEIILSMFMLNIQNMTYFNLFVQLNQILPTN